MGGNEINILIFDTLTPSLSFGHNLCFKFSNGSCKPILDIFVSKSFHWYKERFNPMSFDSSNRSLNIWQYGKDSNSQSGSPLGSVWAHSCTPSYTPVSMKCDSRVSFSVRTFVNPYCCNLNLGLTTNAKACKVASQKGSMRITSHVSGV